MENVNTWTPLHGDVSQWAARQLSIFMGPAGRVVGTYRRSDGPHAVVYALDGACYAVPVNAAAATSVDLHGRDIARTQEATAATQAGQLPPEWKAWRGESRDLYDDALAALLASEGHPPLQRCPEALIYEETPLSPEALAMRDRVEVRLFPAASDSERHALESLLEVGIANPSTALLRARLMLDHTKEARDLGHGWPDMLGAKGEDLAILDMAEHVAQVIYAQLLDAARLRVA